MNKTIEEIAEELRKPFNVNEIEWRVQSSGVKSNGEPWAIVLAYVSNRAIQRRLDDVVGIDCWKNEFFPGPHGGVVCALSLKLNGEWVTKYDGADNTNIEAVKGGLSGAMKRAASQWGIGRYLYYLDECFATILPQGQKSNYRGSYKGQNNRPVYFYFLPPKLPDFAIPKFEEKIDRKINELDSLTGEQK